MTLYVAFSTFDGKINNSTRDEELAEQIDRTNRTIIEFDDLKDPYAAKSIEKNPGAYTLVDGQIVYNQNYEPEVV